MPLDFLVGARAVWVFPGLQGFKKVIFAGTKSLGRLSLRQRFIARGVLTELYTGVELVDRFADIGEPFRGVLPECYAALLGAELVLKNKIAGAAFSHPQPEARDVVVEENCLAFAGGQRLSAHRGCG